MVVQTPLYTPSPTENASSEVINTELKTTIQESINYLLASPCAKQVERTQNVPSVRPSREAPHEENSTRSCNGTAPTTKPQDIRLDEDNNENDWTRVDDRKNGRDKKQTFCVELQNVNLKC